MVAALVGVELASGSVSRLLQAALSHLLSHDLLVSAFHSRVAPLSDQMMKMSVMRYAKSRIYLLGTILTALCLSGVDPFEPESDGIYEMKLLTHPPIATNIRDFGTPIFDFEIKPRKLNISTKANNNIGDINAPDFEPGSDSIMKYYCGG